MSNLYAKSVINITPLCALQIQLLHNNVQCLSEHAQYGACRYHLVSISFLIREDVVCATDIFAKINIYGDKNFTHHFMKFYLYTSFYEILCDNLYDLCYTN